LPVADERRRTGEVGGVVSECDFDGFCGGTCPGAVPDFRGSYWGCVGKYLTRLPEYIKASTQIQPAKCGDEFYPYPYYRPHPTLSRELPNLTDADDVERECFGAACSMVADASPLTTTGTRGLYGWWLLHYVPVGEKNLDNAVAALAVAQVGSFTEEEATASIGVPTVWLINDANGDPEVWDSQDKLDVYTATRKAFVGTSNFGYFEKRLSSGTVNRITVYSTNDPDPVVTEWDNSARLLDEISHYSVCDVSRTSFPLAVGCHPAITRFGDSSISEVTRVWIVGEVNTANGHLTKPATVDSDEWDVYTASEISNSCMAVYGRGGGERDDIAAPLLTETNTEVVLRSWEAHAYTIFDPPPSPELDPTPRKVLNDAAVFNGTFTNARTLSDTDPDFEWNSTTVANIPAWTWPNSGEDPERFPPCDVGYQSHPIINGRVARLAAHRYVPGYGGGFASAAEANAVMPFVLLSAGGPLIATADGEPPGTGISGLTGTSGGGIGIIAFFYPSQDGDLTYYGGTPDQPKPTAALVRVTYDAGSGADPDLECRVLADGYTVDRTETTWCVTLDLTADPLPTGWRWSNSKRPDLPIAKALNWTYAGKPTGSASCAPYYDSSVDGVLQVIPAPSGFWRKADGTIHRGAFAVAPAYDDHHPTLAMIWEPGTTGFIE
jgi:hypothetical protein